MPQVEMGDHVRILATPETVAAGHFEDGGRVYRGDIRDIEDTERANRQ